MIKPNLVNYFLCVNLFLLCIKKSINATHYQDDDLTKIGKL